MTLVNAELYIALRKAGVDEPSAAAAAEAVYAQQADLAKVKAEVRQWMALGALALIVLIVVLLS
jgi:hypothetical protein